MKGRYIDETAILDYNHASIQKLIDERGWRNLSDKHTVKEIYYFLRDEIKFGYNRDDTISASEVLASRYGQCNTKSTLFMALLRALKIPCRFHGFTIYNALQSGAIPVYLMPMAPKRILHSWVEVLLADEWLNVEGYIIDQEFLAQVQAAFPDRKNFSGYGISVPCLQKPNNEFDGNDTYIQADGIADDFGRFDAPDEFYAKYGTNLRGLKKILYRYVLRHLMNHNVNCIRKNGLKAQNTRPG